MSETAYEGALVLSVQTEYHLVACAQVVEVVEDTGKWPWLRANVQSFIDQGDVLVFVSTKVRAEELSGQLQGLRIKYVLLPEHHLECLCSAAGNFHMQWCAHLDPMQT